jgi:hypothetical protein
MEKKEETSAQPPPSLGQEEKASGTLGPYFKMVFRSLIALTASSLVVQLGLITGISLFVNSCELGHGFTPPAVVAELLQTCSLTWKVGFGAVVTLAVGKALDILKVFRTIE